MTPVDPMDVDMFIRDALRTTRPERAIQFADVEAVATVRLRRGRIEMLSAAVAVAAAVALLVGLAMPGARSDAGRVTTKPSASVPGGHSVAPPAARSTTTLAAATVTAPVTTSPARIVHPPAPVVTPITNAPAPVPQNPPPTAAPQPHEAPSTTTSPTTVPIPATVRITVVIDDAGLHAPATLVAGGTVEVFFLDERSARPAPAAELHVVAPGVDQVIARSVRANDPYGYFGGIYQFPHLLGAVDFTARYTATHSDIANGYATTVISAS